MRKFLSAVLLPAVLFILPGHVFSQATMKLSGTVSDSSRPLALVTVRLFKKNNKAPLQTTLSKENGSFQFNKPDTGNYMLSFTYTGFTEYKININVASRAGDMQIDPVQLTRAPGTLTAVVVNGQRPLVEQSDDKIVFNVEDDPASKTETAIDILRKTPFITVDGEDNIKVNGKSNFKVLLNGRETSMFARNVKEALRGFPGVVISKIEVITTPSAKYDGEGIGGLINIITKKKVVGYNGTLSSFSRTSDKMNNFSVNGNAKVGNVGLSVFLNSGITDPVQQHNTSTTIPSTQNIYAKRTLDGDQQTSSGWSFGNAELSWELDSLNTISLYTNIDSWRNKTITDQTITTDYASAPSTVSYYSLNNKTNNPGVNVGSDFIKHFRKNKEREFSLRFLGEFGKNDAKLNSFQDNPGTDRYLINNSYATNNQFTIQADNSIPVSKNGKFEGGLKAILRRASSDFQSLVKYDAADNYSENATNTDHFKYNQNVISLYSMYSLRWKKSSFRAGVRAEYTSVNGDFISSKTRVDHRYVTFLPNVQFTNRMSQITTLVFTYSKRLQRPYIWDLNPFVYNNDSLNISFGNPNLGPQTVHALSGQLRYARGNTFAGINIEGSYSGNKILQYSSFDPQTGITKTTSLNIGKEIQSSLNLNFSTKITPKWSLFVNGSLRYSTVKNNSDVSQSNSGWGCNFNLNTNYRFSDKFSVSSYLGLWQEPRTIQTTYPFNTWHNVAFNYKIFKNKINISLRAVNYTEKTHDFNTITKDRNFYNTNITRQIRRGGVLAVTWNFGKLSENVSKKKGVNNDDILSKPAAPGSN
ncbi:outer membrane beta-barrel protein [Flavitalea sp. BT771]|uniref:outer membrane beta-barrel protein n=1 Tax=Flavitalea sp. BT771 TaxID=3063329 RepID=UPI0026E15CD4|nr:outer membrane beta-barrel protein [Flavitalea sp. BT771]MDO6430385.1 outer membrane beta-barrel protein [Flavitalea sp. BT771]MDV6219475.1 outer membrane beta-barrel protein [Flavitalea sp. BT771]